MMEIAHSIDLNLPEKLKDREYRQSFFLAETSAQIAEQLIALRKRRDLNQGEVAKLTGTQQPAISRIEKADYQSWSFSVLRKIAGALDARIRVLIEPSEDILDEYREPELDGTATPSDDPAIAATQVPPATGINYAVVNGQSLPSLSQESCLEGYVIGSNVQSDLSISPLREELHGLANMALIEAYYG